MQDFTRQMDMRSFVLCVRDCLSVLLRMPQLLLPLTMILPPMWLG